MRPARTPPILLLTFALATGCDQPPASSPAPARPAIQPVTPPSSPPALPSGARLDPSEKNLPPTGSQVELSAGSIERLPEYKYRAALQYRFTAGLPDPARKYTIHVRFTNTPHYELGRFEGNSLKEEGSLQWEFALPQAGGKSPMPPKEFEMSLQEEESREGRSGYAGKSNTIRGEIKP